MPMEMSAFKDNEPIEVAAIGNAEGEIIGVVAECAAIPIVLIVRRFIDLIAPAIEDL